jgi:hypothetical protein
MSIGTCGGPAAADAAGKCGAQALFAGGHAGVDGFAHPRFFLELRVDGVQQFGAVKGFGEVVVGAGCHAAAHAFAVVQRGQQHEGGVGQRAVGAHGGQQLKAVHAGHADVGDDQVGRVLRASSRPCRPSGAAAVSKPSSLSRRTMLLRMASSSSTIRIRVMEFLRIGAG